MASSSLIASIALILCIICTFNGVRANEYTLQSNCAGFDWNGIGCVPSGQIVTVPVGNHTVHISGNLTALYPVVFTTNTTTKALWSGAFPNDVQGTQIGDVLLVVDESDVGNFVYYQCAGTNCSAIFGTIIFVASEDVNVTDLSSSSSSTGAGMSSSTGMTGGSTGGGFVTLTSNGACYSWNGANCSASPADIILPVGVTYVTLGGSNIASHPVVFTTEADSVVPWRGADPNPSNGTSNGTIALTVTAADQGTVVYYRSVPGGFFGRIWLVSTIPLAMSSSSSSSGGIISNATSTGGVINVGSSTGTIIIVPGSTGTDIGGNPSGTSGTSLATGTETSVPTGTETSVPTGTETFSSTGAGATGGSTGLSHFPESTGGLSDSSAPAISPAVAPAIAALLVVVAGRLLSA